MPRFWTCRKCRTTNPRTAARCRATAFNGLETTRCSGRRPAPRRPKHSKALDLPYSWWVEQFGERCGICHRAPSATRKLDRDHDHKTGEPRGLLCWYCNKLLHRRMDVDWLLNAARYLDADIGTR